MSALDSAEELDLAVAAAATSRSPGSSGNAPLTPDPSRHHRHHHHHHHHCYSTIGIGDHAFLVPPTHPLPTEYYTFADRRRPNDDDKNPKNASAGATSSAGSFVSDEIAGAIKNSPADFVVREIACTHRCATAAHRAGLILGGRVADLGDEEGEEGGGSAVVVDAGDSTSADPVRRDRASVQFMEEPLPPRRRQHWHRPLDPVSLSCDEHAGGVNETSAAPEHRDSQVEAIPPAIATETPAASTSIRPDHLASTDPITTLTHQLDHTQEGSDEWLCRLRLLSESVVERLRHEAEDGNGGVAGSSSTSQRVLSFLLLPRRSRSTQGEEDESSGGVPLDRGMFHRAIRCAFPMLVAESTKGVSSEGSRQDHDPRCDDLQERDATVALDCASYRVTVTPDPLFLSLSPLLHEPHVDLPHLYSYYKGSLNKTLESNSRRDDAPGVVLRLKPGLPRTERRHVHHTIETKSNQNLVTVTRTNASQGPADPGASSDGADKESTMASIVVQWSKIAQRRLAKRMGNQGRKRQRTAPTGDMQGPDEVPPSAPTKDGEHADGDQSCNERDNLHSLFVLKKTGIEHLTAQHCLADLLKCRQADLGLAGIKDTVATTYQFCTVRNYDAARLVRTLRQRQMRSNVTAGSGIEIGSVRPVNWLLNKGDLDGNRFEIVLRDVRRVHVDFDSRDGSARELFVPCPIDHVASRIDSVVRSGFCNFYGEQRVGIPGSASVVGVRGFDVGKSMLQQNFGDAVDKIMTGRIVVRDYDNREPEDVQKVRRTWKHTGGDPHRTWKVLPRGSSMARERLILKGLKRYGDPLLAIRCVHFHERMFWVSAFQSYVWNAMTSERIRRYGTSVVIGDLVETGDDGQVEIVTTELLQKPGCRFEDVVLPLPGYDVIYPTNEIGEHYRDLLERDGVSFRKDAPPEGTAKGSYRRLVSRAYNVSFEVLTASGDEKSPNPDVKLRFDLPTGCYATMFLRELMLTTVVRDMRNATSS